MNKEILDLYETDHSEQETNTSSEIHKKRKAKHCKKAEKLLKKQNKYLKQLARTCKFQDERKRKEENTRENHADSEQQERDKQSKKSFWSKLGDAIVKAVPIILNTITAAVCTFFFGGKYRSGSTRHGCAMG